MFEHSGVSRQALRDRVCAKFSAAARAGAMGALLALPFVPATSLAQSVVIAQEIDGPYIVTWASANVRSAPTVESDLLAELTLGQFVDVTGLVEGEEWYRVRMSDGRVGYIWAEVMLPLRPDIFVRGGGGGGGGGGAVDPDLLAPDPNNNDIYSATPIDPPSDMVQTLNGMVGEADYADTYRFELTDWTEVSVRMTGLGEDADLRLMDSDGYDIISSTEVGAVDEVIVTVLGAGVYYLEAYYYEADTNYELIVSGVPGEAPPDDMGGDSVETATDLGLLAGEGLTTSEWVGTIDNNDYYAFEVASRTRITFRLDNITEDLDLFVIDERGQTIGSAELGGVDAEEVNLSLRPGRYFAHVLFYGNVGSNYDLSIAPYRAQ